MDDIDIALYYYCRCKRKKLNCCKCKQHFLTRESCDAKLKRMKQQGLKRKRPSWLQKCRNLNQNENQNENVNNTVKTSITRRSTKSISCASAVNKHPHWTVDTQTMDEDHVEFDDVPIVRIVNVNVNTIPPPPPTRSTKQRSNRSVIDLTHKSSSSMDSVSLATTATTFISTNE